MGDTYGVSNPNSDATYGFGLETEYNIQQKDLGFSFGGAKDVTDGNNDYAFIVDAGMTYNGGCQAKDHNYYGVGGNVGINWVKNITDGVTIGVGADVYGGFGNESIAKTKTQYDEVSGYKYYKDEQPFAKKAFVAPSVNAEAGINFSDNVRATIGAKAGRDLVSGDNFQKFSGGLELALGDNVALNFKGGYTSNQGGRTINPALRSGFAFSVGTSFTIPM